MNLVCLYYNMTLKPKMKAGYFFSRNPQTDEWVISWFYASMFITHNNGESFHFELSYFTLDTKVSAFSEVMLYFLDYVFSHSHTFSSLNFQIIMMAPASVFFSLLSPCFWQNFPEEMQNSNIFPTQPTSTHLFRIHTEQSNNCTNSILWWTKEVYWNF